MCWWVPRHISRPPPRICIPTPPRLPQGRPRQSPKAGSASLLAAVPRQRSAAPAWQPSFAALADIPRAVTTIEDGPSPKVPRRPWSDFRDGWDQRVAGL